METVPQKKTAKFIKIAETYKQDIDQINSRLITAEYKLWINKFVNIDKANLPKYCIELLKFCDEIIFPSIFTILKRFCALPMITSTPKQSFSTLKKDKNFNSKNRLNGSVNLNIHREMSVDPNDVLTILQQKSRRLNFAI